MYNYKPDIEPDPDEVSTIEEANRFITDNKKRILSQIKPLASQLNTQWHIQTANKKKID